MVYGLGFRVWDLGFGVWCFGLRGQGFEFRNLGVCVHPSQDTGGRIGSKFQISGFRISGLRGFRVSQRG